MSASFSQFCACRACGDGGEAAFDGFSGLGFDAAGMECRNSFGGQNADSLSTDLGLDQIARARPEFAEQILFRLQYRNLGADTRRLREAVFHRERQFHSRHAASDDRRSRRSDALGDRGCEFFPFVGKAVQRFGGAGMLFESGNVSQLGRRPDIDGCHIVSDVRATGDFDRAVRPINSLDLAEHQPRAGMARQPYEIDFKLFAAVMSCDKPRQHSGVGRFRVGIDQRKPCSGNRIHAPGFERQRMRVSAADECDIAVFQFEWTQNASVPVAVRRVRERMFVFNALLQGAGAAAT